VHADVETDPILVLYVPTGQLVHTEAPVELMKVPAGHARHWLGLEAPVIGR